jgi:hypothetical protein
VSEPIKIHPFDAYRLLSERMTHIDMVKYCAEQPQLPKNQLIIDGQLYEQSTDVPASEAALKLIS